MMVDSFIDHRSDHIKDYNSAVDNWDQSQRLTFRSIAGISVEGATTYRSPEYYLSRQQSDSTPASKDGSGCHEDQSSPDTYTPLKWTANANSMYDASPYCNYNNGCQTNNVATLQVYIGAATSTLKLPLFKAESRSVQHRSDCTNGDFYESGQCIEYSYLYKLCVKVSQSSGNWYLDSSYGGYGCGDNANWQPGAYRSFKVYNSGDFPGNLNIDVTVRSLYDPLVQFYAIVGTGASSFGMCQRTKFVVGVVLLSVFVLFCIVLPIMVARFACGWCGGKKYSREEVVEYHPSGPSYQEHLVQPSTAPSAPPTAPPQYAPQPSNNYNQYGQA